MTVKNALTELETAGLIERRRQGFSLPNRKIPDGQDIVLLTDRKLSPNNMSNNNLRDSNLSRVSERLSARGRYGNVFLTEAEVAGCIANALMEQEVSVRMTNFALILNDLIISFEGRSEYIARLCRAPLLILDDFGMDRGTEYGLEQVYSVIDSRYRSRRPLIVTANIPFQELQNPQDTAHTRIYDRLLEVCAPIRFSGENFRRATAQDKLKRLKNLMK